MTENITPNAELMDAATPPRLSDAALADYERLLADRDFAERDIDQNAALKVSVENALAATGQRVDAAPDPWSQAQRLHDRLFGIEPRDPSAYQIELPNGYEPPKAMTTPELIAEGQQFLAGLQVAPYLGRVILQDVLANPEPDPAEVAATIERSSMDYKAALRDAQYAIDRASDRAVIAGIRFCSSAWMLGAVGTGGRHL